MATDFPTSLDTLTNPTGTDNVSTVDHAAQHTNKNDAIEAIEAKVGIDSSADTDSHDYKLANPLTNATGYTKGDIKAGTGVDTSVALGVGANDTVLTADSSEASGMKWAAGTTTQFRKDFTAGENLVAGDAVRRTPGVSSQANSHSIDLELGSTQYLSIADGSQTGLEPASDFSIEFDFNPETLNIRQDIVSKFDDSVGGYTFGLNPSNELELQFFNGASKSLFSQTTATISSTATWYHIAISVDVSAPSCVMYIDGVSVPVTTDASAATSMTGTTSDFQIGKRADEANFYTDGLVDNVRFWDDIRTAAEVLGYKDVELTGSEINLQGYWQLNNDLTDSTANGNDLTNNGSAVFSTTVPFSTTEDMLKVGADGAFNSFVGFANATISSGNSGQFVIGGEMTGLSNLVPGEPYYLSDTDGAITLTPGSNTKQVGVATSATALLISNG